MRPIGGELVTTITSSSCWGTHFLYLSNPPAGIPVPIIPWSLWITMGHLRVTIGHLRVTVGHPLVTMGHLRLTIGYLKATAVHIRVKLGHLEVTIGYFFL